MIHELNQEFYGVIERDEDGIYVGEVPQLRACYSQSDTQAALAQGKDNVKQLPCPGADFTAILPPCSWASR
ncbi:MAG: type II toxin-antitoxin system HicB family antitoxin [Phormidesmis sp. CAN_BIN36]|nr:type II toxin-antitoxin system HicB family antitoxin [Phormidesmis sp. CAN_BIN36]